MHIPMKKHTFFLLSLLVTGLLFVACSMNQFDDMTFTDGNFPYGNNAIPADAPITTIQDLKTVKYPQLFQSTSLYNYQYTTIEEDLYISGRIVSNDESGNVYKTIAIADETGAVVIGVNSTGLYSYLPMGQKVIVSLKGLDFGAYSNMPEVGKAFMSDKYGLQLGRISQKDFEAHVRLVGKPEPSAIAPEEMTEALLKNLKATDYPRYVVFRNVSFADGGRQYAPVDNTTEDRYLNVGSQKIDCRMSSYSNFALDTIPRGKVSVTGLLTLYGSTKQLLVRVREDIK